MTRWIRVSVDVFDHDISGNEPFSRTEAWLWIIAKASWMPTRHRIGNEVHEVPVGSFFVTGRELQKTWRWKSLTRVQSFIALLEKEGMISVNKRSGKSLISVCNYEQYQQSQVSDRSTKGQEKVSDRSAIGQEKVTKDTNTPDTPIHQKVIPFGDKSPQGRQAPRADQDLKKQIAVPDEDVPLEKRVFDYGKQVLGKSAGGLITKLRKACEYQDDQVMEALEEAAQKQDPKEWICARLKGTEQKELWGGATPTGGYVGTPFDSKEDWEFEKAWRLTIEQAEYDDRRRARAH